MASRKKPTKRFRGPFTLGRINFAKISAVEGITITGAMNQDFHDFEKLGLSHQKRRKLLVEKYGKAR